MDRTKLMKGRRRRFHAVAAMWLAASPVDARDDSAAIATTRLADGVYLMAMPSTPRWLGSNVGFVVLEDYVIVIDAGFAPGARLAKEEIAKVTDKPVRFVVDTHHHPDHAFGNGVFAAAGATIVCHARCLDLERGPVASGFAATKASPDDAWQVEGAEWKAGTLTFQDRLAFDDGKRRVELLHLGHGHTPGDVVVWLPVERVLFTGDACVNGAFNYCGDSDTASWIRVLDRLEAMASRAPLVVAPGHGPAADAAVIARQKRWFTELRAIVGEQARKGATVDEILAAMSDPGRELAWYAEWTGVAASTRRENVEHVLEEITGLLPPAGLVAELGLTADAAKPRDRPGWTPPRKVLVGPSIPLTDLAYVARGIDLVPVANASEAAAKAQDADAVIGFCTAAILEQGERLRWVAVGSAGVERYVSLPQWDAIEAAGRDCVLTNAQRIHGPPIAEHVFAMVLALTRGLRGTIPLQEDGNWDPSGVRGDRDAMSELKGRTLLVAGLGGIGSEVARIGHGLGMRVIATKRTPGDPPPGVDRVGGAADLLAYSAEADVVVNCLPLTPETERLFDRAFFAALKDGAYFVTIGRGRSCVTADLVAALKAGRLRGAALDVTDPEPLPSDHELWRMPNVIITPHVSAGTGLGGDRLMMLHRENLRRFVAGEPLLNVVDRKAGY